MSPSQPDRPLSTLLGRLRHLALSQPGLFGFVLVVASWIAIHAPGIGRHGLWDPWEMDRAHVALQMTGAPRVVVVEARTSEGAALGETALHLTRTYGDALQVSVPEAAAARGVPIRLLDKASEILDRSVQHAVFVDLRPFITDAGSHAELEDVAIWLEKAAARNPTTEFVLLTPATTLSGEDAAAYLDRLRATYAEVRVELAGRELDGVAWGKPGPFRAELLRLIKSTREQGYRVVPELAPLEGASYLEKAFIRAAETRDLVRRMRQVVPKGVAGELAASSDFALPARTLVLPVLEGGLLDRSALAPLIEELAFRPWKRAEFKRDGMTRTLPPLDSWLMAASMSRLGTSEFAARLPFFLLGLLSLIAVFYAVRTAFGAVPATLAGLALVSSPLFFSAGRSLSGGMTTTAAIAFAASGLLLIVHRGGLRLGSSWLLAVGVLMAGLAEGVVGMVVIGAMALVYVVAARDFRMPVLLAAGALALAAAALAHFVHYGEPLVADLGWVSPWLSWNIKPEERPVFLNFDDLFREIGFGAAPWSTLLPVAIGALALRLRSEPRERPFILLLVWLLVPYVVQSAVFKYSSHQPFPAIPAVAVLVGLFLYEATKSEGGLRGGLSAPLAFTAALLLALLVNDARKSPEPLTSFLTFDPPLAGIKEESDYPEAVKLPPLLLGAFLLTSLFFLTTGLRVISRAATIWRSLSRARSLVILSVIAATAIASRLLIGLESEIAEAFTTRAGQLLEASHRLYVRDVFYWRPHHWALLVVAGVGILVLLGAHTRVVSGVKAWLERWIATPLLSGALGLVCALASLVLAGRLTDPTLDGIRTALLATATAYGVGSATGLLTRPSPAFSAGLLAMAAVLATVSGQLVVGPIVLVLVLVLAPWLTRRAGDTAPVWTQVALLPLSALLTGVLLAGQGDESSAALVLATAISLATTVALVLGGTFALLRNHSVFQARLEWWSGRSRFIGVHIGTTLASLIAVSLASSAARGTAGADIGTIDSLGLAACVLVGLGFFRGLARHGGDTLPSRGALVVVIGVSAALIGLAGGGLAPLGFAIGALVWPCVAGAAQSGVPQRLAGVWTHGSATSQLTQLALAFGAALVALVLTAAWGTFGDGAIAELTVKTPLFALLVLTVLVTLGLGFAAPATWRESAPWLAALAERRQLAATLLAVLTAGLLGLTGQLFIESGLSRAAYLASALPVTPDASQAFGRGNVVGGAMVLSALLAALAFLPAFIRSVRLSLGAITVPLLLVAVLMITALSRKWLQLEPIAGNDGEPFLRYLFLTSRTSLATYAVGATVLAIAAIEWGPALLRRLAASGRGRELLALAAGLALAGALGAVLGLPRPAAAAVVVLGLLGLGAVALPRALPPLRRALDVLGRPFIAATLFVTGEALLLMGAGYGDGGWALASCPVLLAVALLIAGRRPLTGDERVDDGGPALWRGLVQIALVLPVLIGPPALALALGAPRGVDAVLAACVLGAFVVSAHALLIAFRRGLGLVDVLGRLPIAAPTAILFGLASPVVVRLATSGGSANLTLLGVGALLLALSSFALMRARSGEGAVRRLLFRVESPRAVLVVLPVLALGTAFVFDTQLVSALSLHVSQKHLIDTLREAEGGEVPAGRVFQHGLTGQSDRNFYTNRIPELKDDGAAIRALVREKDEVVTVTMPGGGVGTTAIIPGYSAANDKDGDGRRDVPAHAGVTTALDIAAAPIITLHDAAANWTPDAWKGGRLIDSEGWRYAVVANAENTLQVDLASARGPEELAAKNEARQGLPFDASLGPKNAYRVFAAGDALDEAATATMRQRLYMLLPKVGGDGAGRSDRGSFSTLNHAFRRQTGGRHIPVIDDRSSRILLATSELLPGEVDKNPIRSSLIDEAEFTRLTHAGLVRGNSAAEPLSGMAVWDDSLSLVGYSVDPWVVQRGKKFKLSLYFHVKKPVTQSYKLFVHADRGGNRIHTDHWPLAVSQGKEGKHCVGCFQTDHWMAGDIVVDVYEREVPFGAPTGEHDLFLGLFNPDDSDKRVKVTTWNDKLVRYGGNDDRPRIGSFVVR